MKEIDRQWVALVFLGISNLTSYTHAAYIILTF